MAMRVPAGAMRAHLLGPFGDVLDAVVDEEDLAAAPQLLAQRLAEDLRIEAAHEGADRQAVGGRRRDDRDLAQAAHRHLQRARDRRRRQRQHVDLGAQLLEALLVRDAEALLLVDDHQAEILEAHVASTGCGACRRRRRACPAASAATVFCCSALLRKRDSAATLHREVVEALGEGHEVLLGQHRRRREDRHLLAAQHRQQRRAQRDLGLAVADVAADQPVHGPPVLHVVEHGLDRLAPDRASPRTGRSPRTRGRRRRARGRRGRRARRAARRAAAAPRRSCAPRPRRGGASRARSCRPACRGGWRRASAPL